MIKEIFIKIAKLYGLNITENIDTTEFYETSELSVTAILSQRLATITLIDSNVNVSGDNKRAEYINKTIQEFENTKLQNAITITLGTGDCLLKPYTDGENVGINLIANDNFAVTKYVGNQIKGCLIKCDEYKTDRYTYERVEYHHIEDGALHIDQLAFKNGTPCSLDKTIWNYEDVIIPNTSHMPFGRIKCPTIDRTNLNGFKGVPITHKQTEIVKEIKDSYRRFNKEMADKETMIFADKSLLQDTSSGVAIPKRKLFQKVRGANLDSALIQEYSPSIRATELEKGLTENWRMLELACGLSSGVVTAPTTSFATATEIKTNLGMTFAYMQNLRKMVESGINALVTAIDVICNANEITPSGTYEVIYDWSDSYIQDITSRATLLLQGEAIGATTKAEFRSLVMNEPLEIAESKIEAE